MGKNCPVAGDIAAGGGTAAGGDCGRGRGYSWSSSGDGGGNGTC